MSDNVVEISAADNLRRLIVASSLRRTRSAAPCCQAAGPTGSPTDDRLAPIAGQLIGSVADWR